METPFIITNNMFYTKVGTVLVRMRCEKCPHDFGGESVSCRVSCESRVAATCDCRDSRRTRRSCQSSDCDCKGGRCRPHRTKKIWRRYVNVFAAVCILFFIEGLLPQTLAAPQRLIRRKMERTKRDSLSHDENPLWSNPCDYKNANDKPVLVYKPENAGEIAKAARRVRDEAVDYSNNFSQSIHSFNQFKDLLAMWEKTEWLRNYPWFEDSVLPITKTFYEPMPEEYMSKLMEQIDEILPTQYKALKMVVAALDAMGREGFNDQPTSYLKTKITQTMHGVRGVLCEFNALLQSRNLSILKIESDEIPHFNGKDSDIMMMLVYRDTLNILHYLEQVFEAMSNVPA